MEKVFNREVQGYEKFCHKNEAFRTTAIKALTHSGTTAPTIVALSYVNYALSACVGGLLVLAGLTDLGALASYLVYVRQSSMLMNQLTQQINLLLTTLSGAEHTFDTMNEEQGTDEGTVALYNVCRDGDGTLREYSGFTQEYAWKERDGGRLIPLREGVRFSSMTPGCTREKTIFNGTNLYVKPGQKIAFVSSTGAGRTTVINLVNRFYGLDSGTITYDGVNVRDIKKDGLCRPLSMVIQDAYLFISTAADSIRYRRLDATREDVINAAKVASAHSFIRRFPQGHDTILHSDGSNLSQGQRQLLAIARAAIFPPPVLILDEATSSIDTRTEKLIEKDMDALMDGCTIFIITHRLPTVRGSKAILVLEKDETVERGSHDELLEEKGRYYRLYTGQLELEQEKWGILKRTNRQIRSKQPAAPTRARLDPWKGSLSYD